MKTADQVRAECRAKGVTIASIAEEKGWRPQDVYKVLNGQIKGNFGKSHDIAVFFGLKKPIKDHAKTGTL